MRIATESDATSELYVPEIMDGVEPPEGEERYVVEFNDDGVATVKEEVGQALVESDRFNITEVEE